jgi:hypothetical protein
MKDYQIIDEHIIIRETVGYDILKDIEVSDIPNVLKFLKIVFNYKNMSETCCL